jgi:hypothetical protein
MFRVCSRWRFALALVLGAVLLPGLGCNWGSTPPSGPGKPPPAEKPGGKDGESPKKTPGPDVG